MNGNRKGYSVELNSKREDRNRSDTDGMSADEYEYLKFRNEVRVAIHLQKHTMV
jgi:hypothetical protein